MGSICYQKNDSVLHSDTSQMPLQKRAWASWNYFVPPVSEPHATLTYYMNRLQSIPKTTPFLITLNSKNQIPGEHVFLKMVYEHPLFTAASIASQKRHREISGINRTHYCGAYWGYGFHEDGVNSALAACSWFGKGNLP